MGEARRKRETACQTDAGLVDNAVANSQRSGDRHRDTEARRAYMAELMRRRRAQAAPTPRVVDNVVDNEPVETPPDMVAVSPSLKPAWTAPVVIELDGNAAIIRRAYARFETDHSPMREAA